MAQTSASVNHIFDLLRELPETTRTDLVARTGFSKATVSETIAHFLANNLVSEVGKREPRRGRRQVLLRLRAHSRLVIGAEFNEQGCRAVLADLRANPLQFAARSFSSTSAEDFVDALSECVNELRTTAKAPILGIGVGVPGLVDDTGRSVAISVPYNWRKVPIADPVEQRTHLPTTIANRAQAAALGEYWQGATEEIANRSHLAYITAGAGIVAGFVFDGHPYYGHVGAAGELGHTTVEPYGPLCGCGNRGCLYMMSSESAVVRRVQEVHGATPDHVRASHPPIPAINELTIDDLHAALEQGHPLVIEAIERAARYLGIAIGNMINIMNPSHVVIGGSIAAFGDVLLVPLRAEIRRRTLWDALNRLTISPSNLGDDVGPVGGAALYLSRVDSARMIHPTGTQTANNHSGAMRRLLDGHR